MEADNDDPNALYASIEITGKTSTREIQFAVKKCVINEKLKTVFDYLRTENLPRIAAIMLGRVIISPHEMNIGEFVKFLGEKYPHCMFTKFVFPGPVDDMPPTFYYFAWDALGNGCESIRSDRTDIYIEIPFHQLNGSIQPDLIKYICDVGIQLHSDANGV